MIVGLDEVKDHLRLQMPVGEEYALDDNLLRRLIGVAEESVAHILKYDTLSEAFPGGVYPESVRHAACLLVAHYYENREPVAFASTGVVPMMIDSLLANYVRYKED